MNKLCIGFAVVVSLASFGCKKKGGGDDAVKKTIEFKDAMCKCGEGDTACAQKVVDDQKKYADEMAKTADKDAKPDPELAKKMEPVMAEYTKCATKAMTPKMADSAKPDEAKSDEMKADDAKPDDAKPGAGIKGTVMDEPFEAKVAWLRLVDGEDPSLYLKSFDAKCVTGDLIKGVNGLAQVMVSAPLKKGVTQFAEDKVYADLTFFTKDNSNQQSTANTGEIEWITIPTETTKGSVRVSITKDPGTKVEGTMEVSMCDPQ